MESRPEPAAPVVVARGNLAMLREVRVLLEEAGIACELQSPPGRGHS